MSHYKEYRYKDDLTLREYIQKDGYYPLYDALCKAESQEPSFTFDEIEEFLGFELPTDGQQLMMWWSNYPSGPRHVQAYAWLAAGFETCAVDFVTNHVYFRAIENEPDCEPTYLVAGRPEPWPEGMSLSREDMYADRA